MTHPREAAIGAILATIGAVVGSIDFTAFLTVALAALIAIVCGLLTYAVAIRETRQEIKAAFDDHLARLHHEHEALQAGSTRKLYFLLCASPRGRRIETRQPKPAALREEGIGRRPARYVSSLLSLTNTFCTLSYGMLSS